MANPTATGIQCLPYAGSATKVLVRWKCSLSHLDHFLVRMFYWNTSRNGWISDGETKVQPIKSGSFYQYVWDPPSGTSLYAKIRPVAAKRKVKKGKREVEVSWWVGAWASSPAVPSPAASADVRAREAKPDAPTVVSAALNTAGTKVYVSYESDAEYARTVHVERQTDGGKWCVVARLTKRSKGVWTDASVKAGHSYRYRARVLLANGKTASDYTSAQAAVVMKPVAVKSFSVKVDAGAYDSEGASGGVLLKWANAGKTGSSFEVQWNSRNVWNTSDVQSEEVAGAATSRRIGGLGTAARWYFRVRRSSAGGNGPWSAVKSVYLGAVGDPGVSPTAPTVSQTAASYVKDEEVPLAWTHNCADGSEQAGYRLSLYLNGSETEVQRVSYNVTLKNVKVSAAGKFAVPDNFVRFVRSTDMPGSAGSTDKFIWLQVGSDSWYGMDFSEVSVSGTTATFDSVSWADLKRVDPRAKKGASIYRLVVRLYRYDPILHTGDDTDAIELDASDFDDGDKLQWRVRTLGANGNWSPWSARQAFRVWARPAVGMGLSDGSGASLPEAEMASYPLSVELTAEDADDGDELVKSNRVIEWAFEVVAAEGHESTDANGDARYVPKGEVVYSYSIAKGESGFSYRRLSLAVQAASISLDSGESYVARAACVTSQGIRSEAVEVEFTARFTGDVPMPEATIVVDEEDLTAVVYPACWALDEDESPTEERRESTRLAVYRVERTGEVVEIASNIANDEDALALDPHPDLGGCTYRVVASDESTGAQSAADYRVDTPVPGVVVQWDEEWRSQVGDDQAVDYAGKRLVLPYGVSLSPGYSPDKELVAFAGRKHRVAYRGTHLGISESVSASVPADEPDMLALVDQLAVYQGDCYVRMPNGHGFWADVTVSGPNLSDDSGNGAVTLDVERVDHAEEDIDLAQLASLAGFTVSFDANGGAGSMESITAEGAYPLPACGFEPQDGYTYAGWSTAADGTGELLSPGDVVDVAAATVFYAIWEVDES